MNNLVLFFITFLSVASFAQESTSTMKIVQDANMVGPGRRYYLVYQNQNSGSLGTTSATCTLIGWKKFAPSLLLGSVERHYKSISDCYSDIQKLRGATMERPVIVTFSDSTYIVKSID